MLVHRLRRWPNITPSLGQCTCLSNVTIGKHKFNVLCLVIYSGDNGEWGFLMLKVYIAVCSSDGCKMTFRTLRVIIDERPSTQDVVSMLY